jgi:hypothetical protein
MADRIVQMTAPVRATIPVEKLAVEGKIGLTAKTERTRVDPGAERRKRREMTAKLGPI